MPSIREDKNLLIDNDFNASNHNQESDLPHARKQVQRLIQKETCSEYNEGFQSSESGRICLSDKSDVSLIENDCILCIFVVAFDTKSGNIIEWCYPNDFNLTGVEFKAMPSGAHTLSNDFIYFRKGEHFGFAVYQKVSVESSIERGARMKSVGIMATSYAHLYRHFPFLENQVKALLLRPCHYEALEAFFVDKQSIFGHRGNLQSNEADGNQSDFIASLYCNNLEMKICHPAGCFAQFVHFFGAQVFALWKVILLRKRILFYSPPPAGQTCFRCYCCCCLAPMLSSNVSTSDDFAKAARPEPYFYVNVADVAVLEATAQYVACTTERIFERKTDLYDLYVDGRNLRASCEQLRTFLIPSEADKRRLKQVQQLGQHQQDEESVFGFFRELNTRLFAVLNEFADQQRSDRVLTQEDMHAMDLDPVGDRDFLIELLRVCNLDLVLMVDTNCCPR